MNSALRLYPIFLAAAAGLAVGAVAWARSRRKTPEQREQERRLRITTIGRITDGTVLDVSEMNHNGAGEMQLLIYQYGVAGVSSTRVSGPLAIFTVKATWPWLLKLMPRPPSRLVISPSSVTVPCLTSSATFPSGSSR